MFALSDIKRNLRNGKYAWPGGYPMYFVASDGMPLSFESVKENFNQICRAHISGDTRSEWYLAGVEINWEDSDLRCIHSDTRIESAYCEDEEF